MDWIVEDGTGLADANTYLSPDDVRAYALNRGISLPAVDGDTDPISGAMVLAMDYLGSLNYTLRQAVPTQALAWPRKAWYNADPSEWVLPTSIQNAQAQLVIEQIVNSINLFASRPGFNQAGGFILSEKVDVISTTYSDKVIPGAPDMPAVNLFLAPLLAVGGLSLTTVRV